MKISKLKSTKDILLAFKPLDITNNWIQDCLSEILYRYRSKIDPRNRKLLSLYRILGIKYRVLHTLKSRFKNQMILEEEVVLLLDMFVVEAGFNYFIKGESLFRNDI